jgi:hypothetical protein
MSQTVHHLRPWQRQPGEDAADFTAFVQYLRLKGRRSLRAVAASSGRPLGAVRRLSARYHWPVRVHTFEERLAEATQDALDSVLLRQPVAMQSNLEQLRIKEFQLAMDVARASRKWLALAVNPRRRTLSLSQIVHLTEHAFRLARFAAGMPTEEARPRSRARFEPPWTQPSAEEALNKIYGPRQPEPPRPDPAPAPSQPVLPAA